MVNIIIIILCLASPFIVQYYRRHRKVTVPGASVLLSYYTDDVSTTPLSSGVFGKIHYTAIATSPKFQGAQSSLILAIFLPFSSNVHLVGIPKKSAEVQLFPAGGQSILEPISLEGDYNDYFSLYAELGMQVDSRVTLNPKAMEFTIEFCQAFSWEIIDNQLYAVQTAGNTASNTANVANDVVRFVDQIRPAIARPLTDKQIQDSAPYDKEYRTDLKCPVCQLGLVNQSDYLVCPNGDGILLKGAALIRLHAGQLHIPKKLLQSSRASPEIINCPSCGNKMEKVAYNGSRSIIHSCGVCPYRWLDASSQVLK